MSRRSRLIRSRISFHISLTRTRMPLLPFFSFLFHSTESSGCTPLEFFISTSMLFRQLTKSSLEHRQYSELNRSSHERHGNNETQFDLHRLGNREWFPIVLRKKFAQSEIVDVELVIYCWIKNDMNVVSQKRS